jgi:nitroreductase
MRPASTNPDAHPLSSSADRPADVLASETIRAMHLSRVRPAPEFARGQLAAGIRAEGTANAENNETRRWHSGIMGLLARICVSLANVGVLTQTLYLMATDMGLGGCAIGSTNIDLFAKMTGIEFHVEGPVGQFALGRGS